MGAIAIGEGLKVSASLTSLDVGYNNLTEEAALGIVRIERQRNQLAMLGLARSKIGAEGAKEIAEWVAVTASLKTLDLYRNEIGPMGAKAVAEALKDTWCAKEASTAELPETLESIKAYVRARKFRKTGLVIIAQGRLARAIKSSGADLEADA